LRRFVEFNINKMRKQSFFLSFSLAAFLIVSLTGAGCVKKEEDKTNEATSEEVITNSTTNTSTTDVTTETTTNETDTTTDKKVEWKLVSGDPSDTCSAPTYEGETTVRGWYVYDYSYVDKTWLLQVLEADVDKIPIKEVYGEESYAQWVEKPQFLFDATTEQVEDLKKASQDNPIEVSVKAFRAYCEGAPQLSQSGFDDIWQ